MYHDERGNPSINRQLLEIAKPITMPDANPNVKPKQRYVMVQGYSVRKPEELWFPAPSGPH